MAEKENLNTDKKKNKPVDCVNVGLDDELNGDLFSLSPASC